MLGPEHHPDGAGAVREAMKHHRERENEAGLASCAEALTDDHSVDEAMHRKTEGASEPRNPR
jgi:hypothetical protein